jgi:hypothetical protein
MSDNKKVAPLIEYWSKHKCFRCNRRAINPKVAKNQLKLREFCNGYICEKCYVELFVGGDKS